MKKAAWQFFIAFFLFSGSTSSADALQKTLLLTSNELGTAAASILSLNFKIGAAQVHISRSDDDQILVRAVVTYDDNQPEPALSTINDNGTYTATFGSGYDVQFTALPQVQEWDIVIGSYAIDTDLTMLCGGVSGEFELGGLPLRSTSLLVGAADFKINFTTPTTRPIEIFMVAGTGIKLSMGGLGNTDFEVFGILGSGNTVALDFSGAFGKGSHAVTIIEAGDNTNITVPATAGELVKTFSMAGTMALEGDDWITKYLFPFRRLYTSSDYDVQQVKIDFDVTAVTSKVTIKREPQMLLRD